MCNNITIKTLLTQSLLLLLGGLLLLRPAQAGVTDDIAAQITQDRAAVESGMEVLSDNLVAAFAHRSMSPARLGGVIFGLDASIEYSTTDIDNTAIRKVVGEDNSEYDISSLSVPKLHVGLGLPIIPVDAGLSVMNLGGVLNVTSGEVKYTIYKGGILVPEVTVAYLFSIADFLEQGISVSQSGFDATVSKGFGVGIKIVPYAGLSSINGTTTLSDSVIPAGVDIDKEYKSSLTRFYLGASLQFGLWQIVAETDKTGDSSTTSFKLGIRF